jgi:signal transduction histidine kinase
VELERIIASFQPRARLVSILGEQMISDSVVGLIELVKNAYDADAGLVSVTIEGLDTAETTRITVEDDGFGMTAVDVRERFLSPAIDHKARAKERNERTQKYHRLPIGEKGVGRFAIQQLGRKFVLVTRAEGHPEVVTEISWDDFDRPDMRLADVTFDIIQRDPEIFKDNRSGTRLVLTHARDLWDRSRVEKLQRGLRRLRSPHVEDGKLDFNISLSCPDYEELQQLDQGDLRERFHYRFLALVEANGTMHCEYEARHPALRPREWKTDNNGKSLLAYVRTELTSEKPACGPFYLNLYVWDRTATYLSASGIGRRELDSVAGVSLFRDRLRVLPYGEPGDDWLFLDRDRINNPSERIGNNQVVGYVEISQEETSGLRDKTNREGLIDNPAFRDLRTLVRASIQFFETLWRDDRPTPQTPIKKPEPPPASRNIHQARTVASALGASARDDIPVSVPQKVKNPGFPHENEAQTTLDTPPPLIITQKEAAASVVSELDAALRAQRDIEQRRREERELLLHLAATGQAAERLIHEVGRQSVAALNAVERLRDGGTSSATEALTVLDSALGTLRNEFRLLSPEGGITRFQKRRTVSLREAASIAIELNHHLLDERNLGVSVTGDDFDVFARPSSLVQILDNIINNATYWAQATENNKPPIEVLLLATECAVVVRDNGPGVILERPEAIFEPSVTTRPSGHGLGLYIVRELLASDGGKITLIPHDTGGAWFRLDFSGFRRAGREEAE